MVAALSLSISPNSIQLTSIALNVTAKIQYLQAGNACCGIVVAAHLLFHSALQAVKVLFIQPNINLFCAGPSAVAFHAIIGTGCCSGAAANKCGQCQSSNSGYLNSYRGHRLH
jgi:hypothetical protein